MCLTNGTIVREIRVALQKNEQRSAQSEHRHRQNAISTTDPAYDKKRIEEEKGGLLQGSYRWILNNDDFKRWRKNTESDQLLWIKGAPGKGKTMLICGIIDEVLKEDADESNIAYFFCQANNSQINSATAVLRGIMSLLVKQQGSLIRHIPEEFSGNDNGWVQARQVCLDIFRDTALGSTYLIIDALDECVTDLNKLLKFLEEHSSSYPHVKWLVSSRDWQNINESLNIVSHVKIDLGLNGYSLSCAVQFFIEYKVEELAERKKYTEGQRQSLQKHLESNSEGTFLWVALACEQLHAVSKRRLEKDLPSFPLGLDEMYHKMLRNIHDSKNDDDVQLGVSLLEIVTTVYRPITLDEIPSFLEIQGPTNADTLDDDDLIEIVGLCGSFLTLNQRKITLVHQSAQEFLERVSQKARPDRKQQIHYSIFSKSLKALNSTLQRNIYKLNDPAIPIGEVKQQNPDILATIRYACIYWVHHLEDYFKHETVILETREQPLDIKSLEDFMCNHLLQWIEALSLLRSFSEGASSMLKLEYLLKVCEHKRNCR